MLSAGKVPEEIVQILQSHPDEAIRMLPERLRTVPNNQYRESYLRIIESCPLIDGRFENFRLRRLIVFPRAISWLAVGRRLTMKRKPKGRQTRLKTKLGLPDLEHAKIAVIVSLRSFESQRSYRHSIDEFVAWYCSVPRLSFNKTVVIRYRLHLEDRHLSAGTINVRLAAVRRLAYEAGDSGLLSPDLAAGIRRVKGAKKLGCRLGNWLTAEEARMLWAAT